MKYFSSFNAEHDIFPANNYQNAINLLIYVKMPTIFDILTCISRRNSRICDDLNLKILTLAILVFMSTFSSIF